MREVDDAGPGEAVQSWELHGCVFSRTTTVEEKFELVAAGRGIAVLPRSVAQYYAGPGMVCLPVADAALTGSAWPSSRTGASNTCASSPKSRWRRLPLAPLACVVQTVILVRW